MSKYSVQRGLRQEVEHYKGQVKAYQAITLELLCVALGMTPEEAAAFKLPPIEMRVDYNDTRVQLQLVQWWATLVERHFGGLRCYDCSSPGRVLLDCVRCNKSIGAIIFESYREDRR